MIRLRLLIVACAAVVALAARGASADDSNLPPSDLLSSTDYKVIGLINKQISQGWTDSGVTASKAATDGEWCRRVHLDLIGRIPTVAETQSFLADKGADKRIRLVHNLTETDSYIEEYGRHWTTVWTNTLLGRRVRQEMQGLVRREGLQQYLRTSFYRNRRYDEMVADLVAGEGNNRPGGEEYNGAVNFLLDNLEDNAVQATAKTARIFLGMQVQCTQCHNHPFNEWKQDQFWSFNAFFRQTTALRTSEGNMIVEATLADQDFAGEGSTPEDAEIYYEPRDATLAVAYPKFVDGTDIEHSGYVGDVNRRDELARLMIESPYVSQAIVNRTWGHFFGYGFTKPVDDMGPHNPPSHPDLLNELGLEFKASGTDLKALVRWITLSTPYSLSSRFNSKNEQDDPSTGEPPLFSRFYLRQMTAEQLYESLITATSADLTALGDETERTRRMNDWLGQFTIAFGTDEGDETTTFNGTIPQTLMMMNGELTADATKVDSGSLLAQVAAGLVKVKLPDDDKIKSIKLPSSADKIGYLYEAAFARKPTKKELELANTLWLAKGGDGIGAIQDIWWVLLNSNEFIMNH